MAKRYFAFLLFVSTFSLPGLANAQSYFVEGTVKDSLGKGIPFVSIYADGTSMGVSSNENGEYRMKLPAGNYRIVYRCIGYAQKAYNLQLDRNLELDMVLPFETLQLNTVAITASKEDPAYTIIRKAIAKREKHLKQERNYSVKAYVKGLQRIDKAPEKFLGFDIQTELELDSNNRGIIYLSETESKLHVKKPDVFKEIVYSSKVAGNNNGFSFNQASDMLFSFYQNLLLDELNGRGLVSPIANNALFYYRYRLEGTFKENGIKVNKIKVIPRRKHDPVFSGYIYIVEGQWRIHSLSLGVSDDAQVKLLDSLNIRQTFMPVAKGMWMPASFRFQYSIKLLKFKVSGYFLTVYSDYRMPEKFDKGFFDNELIRVDSTANKRDSLYWTSMRPVALTPEEKKGYVRKDSIENLKKSNHYLDSTDAIHNRFKFTKLIFPGYSFRNSSEKENHFISPLLMGVQFNTVEGLALEMTYRYSKEYTDKTRLLIAPTVRYGFSNEHLNANIDINYRYENLRRASVGIKGGTGVFDFNGKAPISTLFNTAYTLVAAKNLKKIYERRWLEAYGTRELFNGFTLSTSLAYERRLPLINTNFYSFRRDEDEEFTANNPLVSEGNAPAFAAYNALVWAIRADIVFAQSYKTMPNQRIRLDSPYPRLSIGYKKGFSFAGSAVDHDRLSFRVYQESVSLGLLGSSAFSISGGKFLNSKKLPYIDARHFSGTAANFSILGYDSFYLLDNYEVFSTDKYIEGHYEHNFGGFVLNKVPLLRLLKLNTIVGLNYLSTESTKNYWEFFVGIQRLGIKAGWAFSGSSNGQTANGFRIGLGL